MEKCGGVREVTGGDVVRRMRFAYWITKAINTLRICNTYCFSTSTVVLRTRLSVTLYVSCLSVFMFCMILCCPADVKSAREASITFFVECLHSLILRSCSGVTINKRFYLSEKITYFISEALY